jgi:hypothetical protein
MLVASATEPWLLLGSSSSSSGMLLYPSGLQVHAEVTEADPGTSVVIVLASLNVYGADRTWTKLLAAESAATTRISRFSISNVNVLHSQAQYKSMQVLACGAFPVTLVATLVLGDTANPGKPFHTQPTRPGACLALPAEAACITSRKRAAAYSQDPGTAC